MVRPERFELPTFWFVGGIRTPRRATTTGKYQENQRIVLLFVGSFRLLSAPVHGQKADRRCSSGGALALRRQEKPQPARRSFTGQAPARTAGLFSLLESRPSEAK